MRFLLLPLLLVACSDAPDATVAAPATEATATASEADSAAPEADATAPEADDATPEASGDPDLTTAPGLLQALQTAAASGDASAFEPYLELDPDDREAFDEYIAASLLPGGEWHDLLMGLTESDLSPDEGGAYTANMLLEFEAEGETYESAIILRFASLGEEYRVVGATMAG